MCVSKQPQQQPPWKCCKGTFRVLEIIYGSQWILVEKRTTFCFNDNVMTEQSKVVYPFVRFSSLRAHTLAHSRQATCNNRRTHSHRHGAHQSHYANNNNTTLEAAAEDEEENDASSQHTHTRAQSHADNKQHSLWTNDSFLCVMAGGGTGIRQTLQWNEHS